MRAMPQEKWGIEKFLMYMTKTNTIMDASMEILKFNEENQRFGLVTQDVIILTGTEDHFIPLKIHHLQVAALQNVNSLIEHIFTHETQGHNYC